MNAVDWLAYGIKEGFCSMPVCDIHEGVPLSEEESDAFDAGEDPCVVVMRLFTEKVGLVPKPQ